MDSLVDTKMWTVHNSLVILAVSTFVVCYLRFLWRRRYWYIYSWNTPGPLALPIIGATYIFFKARPDEILDVLIDMISNYGNVSGMKFWFGYRLKYGIFDPEQVEKVLTNPKCLGKDEMYRMITKTIGNGLVTAPVDIWKKHRKAIMPSFSQKVLESFVEIFSHQSTIFVENLKGVTPGKKIDDLQNRATSLTLDIICETAMGLKMHSQTEDCEFAGHLEKLLEVTIVRVFKLWLNFDFIWNLLPISKEYKKHKDYVDNVITEVIRQKVKAIKQKSRRDSLTAEIDEGTHKKKLALLDLIMENTNFTEEELKDEISIFLIAGTDTTAITLSFVLEMLGMHQEVQNKVYEEIVDVIGLDRPVEFSDLPKLIYTERAIKETMRLFPMGAFYLRTAGEDIDLGDYIVPEGAGVLVCPLITHRHPKYWPDPLRFDPDRFLPEQVAQRHPCAYTPFSYGARGCIGNKYAMMNMKTFIATTLRRYRFFTQYKSVADINTKTNIVLRPTNGFKVYLEPR